VVHLILSEKVEIRSNISRCGRNRHFCFDVTELLLQKRREVAEEIAINRLSL